MQIKKWQQLASIVAKISNKTTATDVSIAVKISELKYQELTCQFPLKWDIAAVILYNKKICIGNRRVDRCEHLKLPYDQTGNIFSVDLISVIRNTWQALVWVVKSLSSLKMRSQWGRERLFPPL